MTLVTWFVGPLFCDVTIVSFAGLVLGSLYSVQLTFKGRGGILHYLNSLGKISVNFPLYLFHHLYIPVCTRVFIVYCITQYMLFYSVAQIVPALAIGYLSGGLLCPSDTPHPLFANTAFLSGTMR